METLRTGTEQRETGKESGHGACLEQSVHSNLRRTQDFNESRDLRF